MGTHAMTGLEPMLKFFPLAGFILAGAIGYGQIQADINNLQETQKQQFQLIQDQLKEIGARIK